MRSLVNHCSPLTHASHCMTTSWPALVNHWSPLTHASHCMTTSWPALVNHWSPLTHASHCTTTSWPALVNCWFPLTHASHCTTTSWPALVNHWSPLTHASHCMTTSWPAAATQMTVRISPAMHPRVFTPTATHPPAQNMLAYFQLVPRTRKRAETYSSMNMTNNTAGKYLNLVTCCRRN